MPFFLKLFPLCFLHSSLEFSPALSSPAYAFLSISMLRSTWLLPRLPVRSLPRSLVGWRSHLLPPSHCLIYLKVRVGGAPSSILVGPFSSPILLERMVGGGSFSPPAYHGRRGREEGQLLPAWLPRLNSRDASRIILQRRRGESY